MELLILKKKRKKKEKEKRKVHLISTLTKEGAFDGGVGSWAGEIPGGGNRMV